MIGDQRIYLIIYFHDKINECIKSPIVMSDQRIIKSPIAMIRSTNVLETMNPMMNEKQMMIELPMLLTCGGKSSAVTTYIRNIELFS